MISGLQSPMTGTSNWSPWPAACSNLRRVEARARCHSCSSSAAASCGAASAHPWCCCCHEWARTSSAATHARGWDARARRRVSPAILELQLGASLASVLWLALGTHRNQSVCAFDASAPAHRHASDENGGPGSGAHAAGTPAWSSSAQKVEVMDIEHARRRAATAGVDGAALALAAAQSRPSRVLQQAGALVTLPGAPVTLLPFCRRRVRHGYGTLGPCGGENRPAGK